MVCNPAGPAGPRGTTGLSPAMYARLPACPLLSEVGPGRFGRQVSVTDIYHTIPYHTIPCCVTTVCACYPTRKNGNRPFPGFPPYTIAKDLNTKLRALGPYVDSYLGPSTSHRSPSMLTECVMQYGKLLFKIANVTSLFICPSGT